MSKWLVVLIAVGWLWPAYSYAAITINEVAWMGTSNSANDEWIELYNDNAASVSLDGWVLSDGMNLNIDLSGNIGAYDYAVLERTDDSSAPGSAFLIYTGALTNTGATLRLTRTDGGIEDQVSGGENWENIGGDNTTKETAQYTSSGWVTGEPTPGQKNIIESSAQESEEVTGDEEDASSSEEADEGSSPVKTLELPDTDLSLALDIPKQVYVNQPIDLAVEPSGLGKTIMDSLVYRWNFGDLKVATGKEVKHTYSHAGEYVLTIHAAYARHEQLLRKKVKVLPVTFTLSKNKEGDIMLHNKAHYEVDISGYKLKSSGSFKFPPYTIILPQGTITIDKNKIGAHSLVNVYLYDQSGELVSSLSKEVSSEKGDENIVHAPESNNGIAYDYGDNKNQSDDFAFAKEEESVNETENKEDNPVTNEQVAAVASSQTNLPKESWPYLGLVALLGLGVFAVYGSGQKSN